MMWLIMSVLTAATALGAADRVWRSRADADLRRRWRAEDPASRRRP